MTANADLIGSVELCTLSGGSYRQIDYWARTGLIEPVKDANGSGSSRVFHRSIIGRVRALVLTSQIVESRVSRVAGALDLADGSAYVAVTAHGCRFGDDPALLISEGGGCGARRACRRPQRVLGHLRNDERPGCDPGRRHHRRRVMATKEA